MGINYRYPITNVILILENCSFRLIPIKQKTLHVLQRLIELMDCFILLLTAKHLNILEKPVEFVKCGFLLLFPVDKS